MMVWNLGVVGRGKVWQGRGKVWQGVAGYERGHDDNDIH